MKCVHSAIRDREAPDRIPLQRARHAPSQPQRSACIGHCRPGAKLHARGGSARRHAIRAKSHHPQSGGKAGRAPADTDHAQRVDDRCRRAAGSGPSDPSSRKSKPICPPWPSWARARLAPFASRPSTIRLMPSSGLAWQGAAAVSGPQRRADGRLRTYQHRWRPL